MKSFFFATLLVPFYIFAAQQKSAGQVEFKAESGGKAVRALVKSGFHFSAESPAYVQAGKVKQDVKTRSEKEILFELPETKEGSYELRFYVCDDAKTVCEMHRQPWGKLAAGKSAAASSDQSANSDLPAALDRATKENKLVFIDFAASWCPPCIRLEHEVFPTKEFKKASAKYVVVRVDVDKPENEKWMEKYSIKAFPTLVVTNADGEELGRKLDYQATATLTNFLNAILKQTPPTFAKLKEKAEGGDKASQELLALSYLDSMNFAEARSWFDKSESKSHRRAEALVYYWEEQFQDAKNEDAKKKSKEELKKAQKESVEKFPDTLQAIGWQKGYAENLMEDAKEPSEKELAKAEMEKAKSMAMKWIKNPAYLKKNRPQELGDLTLPEIWSMVGEMEEKLGNKAETKAAQENAVQETLKLKPSVKTPTHIIYLVAYMKPVRDLKEIEPWLVKLETAYPQEFTYYQRHAKLLLEKGQSARARPIAEKAYGLAFGSNQLTIGLLLAKIHKELHNKQEMDTLLKDLKSQPYFSTERNKHAAKAINDFENTLKK